MARSKKLIETEHFSVRFWHRMSHWDLTAVSQRWLRDLLWDSLAARLETDPPRSGGTLDQNRRACVELSAFLEARAPGGGHDPRVLTRSLAVDFVADRRHRAEHRLRSLGLQRRGREDSRTGQPSTVTPIMMSHVFAGCRRILRDALDAGVADKIGLNRSFVVAIPTHRPPAKPRSPLPDELARALAALDNLHRLGADFDPYDKLCAGVCRQWTAFVRLSPVAP
ncbi:hypothetical protein ACFVP3_38730 [Streptomyces sp. NPDC057806]|uniref:hypothetical protein n=1 Tax=Streptomyces sp. NPDC057806 TaxID=3346255 RepID=UPI0036ACDCDD